MIFRLKNTVIIKIIKAIFILLLVFIIFLLWRIFEKATDKPEAVQTTFDSQGAYCILELDEITPIWIKWTIQSWDIRIIAWKEVISWSDTSFIINTKGIYKWIEFAIPVQAKYFASNRWKKLYNISNIKALEKMSVKNLIFFNSLQDAKVKWYQL